MNQTDSNRNKVRNKFILQASVHYIELTVLKILKNFLKKYSIQSAKIF